MTSSADRYVTLSRLNTAAAALVVLASFLFPPGLFGFIAYTNVSADMEADTRVTAESVQQIIADLPGQWRDPSRGLDSILASWYRFDQPLGYERLRVIDMTGRQLSAIGAEPLPPRIVRKAVVTENDAPAVTIELERSLRPTLYYIAILGLIGLALAAGSYLTYYIVPLRTLRGHNAILRKRDSELAFAHTLLRAATEGSLDAILVVDRNAQIVTYTQRFIDLWDVPAELVQSGDDAPVLAAVTAQAKDPAAFRARVEYLYAHPDEESRDRIETGDGRVIDRYTRALHGRDNQYLGRIWFFRDITAQEQAAAALRESEVRFRAIFDGTRDGISLAETSSRIFWIANKSFCRMLGYTEDELHGMPVELIHPQEALPEVLDAFGKQARGELDLTLGLPVKRKDGSVFFADINSTPVTIGEKTYLLGVFRDSTERKTAEERLKFANTLLQAEIESAPDAVLVVQNDLKTASYNRNFLDMFAVPPEIEAGHEADALLTALLPQLTDPDAFWRDVHTLREKPDDRIRGREADLRDGRSVEYHGATIRGPAGETLGRIWFFRDVTERREAQEAVRKSEEKYRNLVESATDFVWEIDAGNRYTYYSPSCQEFLGYAPAEIVGKTPFDLMSPKEAARIAAIFEPIAAARRPFALLENTVLAKDGTELVMETSGVPIFDKDGSYRGYRGIERDVTQRKKAEAELKKRDALLHAVAVGATALVTSPSLDQAIVKALAIVSEVLEVDRALVLERPSGAQKRPTLRYAWHASEAVPVFEAATFERPFMASPSLHAWSAEFSRGRIVTMNRSSAPAELSEFFDALGIKSLLVVPTTVDGKYWGQISFHSCRVERPWRDFEVEILTTLADLIGNAIQRDRYVAEIANANRIVQNTPTILYRLRGVPSLPMIYVSQNIRLFGYEPVVLTEAPLLYQNLIHPDDIAAVREKNAQMLESGAASGSFEFRLLMPPPRQRPHHTHQHDDDEAVAMPHPAPHAHHHRHPQVVELGEAVRRGDRCRKPVQVRDGGTTIIVMVNTRCR